MAEEEKIWAWAWRYGWGKLVQHDKSLSGSDPRTKDAHAKSPSDGTEENGVDVCKLPSIIHFLPNPLLITKPAKTADYGLLILREDLWGGRFQVSTFKVDQIAGRKRWGIQVEKNLYGLKMESLLAW